MPLAYLRFEAPDRLILSLAYTRGLVETMLTVWPDDIERLLVTSDVNGTAREVDAVTTARVCWRGTAAAYGDPASHCSAQGAAISRW